MLNVSSPSPLYDDNVTGNISVENMDKRNSSMMGLNEPSARPTLKNAERSLSHENISFEKSIAYEFKIILIGPIAVGKTSILGRYISNEFNDNYNCTVKCEFKTKIININNNVRARLNIWDTMGDERYRAITRQYYQDAHGILLVYDISNRDSFDNILIWEKEVRDNTSADSVLFLVGNKTDLDKERVVTYQEGRNKAENLGMLFTEVSAKSGDNIHLLFEKISEAMMQSVINRPSFKESKSTTKLISDFQEPIKEEEEKKGWCC